MKKTIMLYAVEGIVAAVLIYFSIKLFLVYFFVIWMVKSFQHYDLTRKQIRMSTFFLEVKVLSIMKKLNIRHEEVCTAQNAGLELLRKKHPDLLQSLEKDALDSGLDIYN